MHENGNSAASLAVAEKYVGAFGELAKENNFIALDWILTLLSSACPPFLPLSTLPPRTGGGGYNFESFLEQYL